MDAVEMIDKLNTAVVWCDANFNVIDANPKCKQLFKELLNMENFVGRNMVDCHEPETMAKLKNLFQQYKEKKIKKNRRMILKRRKKNQKMELLMY